MKNIGSCCCGGTVIEITDEPALNGICNCNNCKKRTGSAFGISAYFHQDKFQLLKNTTITYEFQGEHGKQVRHFCGKCGTTIFWYVEIFKGLVGVAGGCFTDNPLPLPTFNAMMENQYSWIKFSESMNKPLTAQDVENA